MLVMIASTPASVEVRPLGWIVGRPDRDGDTGRPQFGHHPGRAITSGTPGCRRPRRAPGTGRPDRRRVVRPAGPIGRAGASACRCSSTDTSNDCRNTRSSCPLARTAARISATLLGVLALDLQQHRRPVDQREQVASRGTRAPGNPRIAACALGGGVLAAPVPPRWSSGRGRRRAGSPAPRRRWVGCPPRPSARRLPRPPRRPAVCSPARRRTPRGGR